MRNTKQVTKKEIKKMATQKYYDCWVRTGFEYENHIARKPVSSKKAMHQINEKAKYWTGLKVIDPDKPDDCLYERYSVNFDRVEKGQCILGHSKIEQDKSCRRRNQF